MNRNTVASHIRMALDHLENMPELDREADIMNLSPDDASAHQAGLAWQELKEALRELTDREVMRGEK